MCQNKRMNKIIAISTAVLLMAAQLFAAAVCFADEGDAAKMRTKTLRDGLFIGIPEDWQIVETGSRDEDAEKIEAGESTFEIAELCDKNGVKQAEMWACVDMSS